MTRGLKFAAAAVLTGALAMAAATPSEARSGRTAAAAGIGFAAGAVVGAAAANAARNNYYYGPGYYEPGYAYEPAYVYEPGYAYAPGPSRGCWVSTDDTRGFGYYGSCRNRNARPIR